MKYVHTEEVRRNFRALLNEVEHDGEHVGILRYQIPAGVIVPPGWHDRAVALMAKYGESEDA